MTKNSIILAVGVAACVALNGCGDRLALKTAVEPSQQINPGAEVIADGQQIGFVRSLRNESDGRVVAELTITNHVDRLRAGTVHVRERGRIVLDTSAANPAGP